MCSDKTLYTGVSNALENRLAKHNNGTGAKYTKGRAPVTLMYTEKYDSHSEALKREYEIKQLKKKDKIKLYVGLV